MDLGVREWMIIIGVLLIVAVVLDGYRRVRNERRGRIRVSVSREVKRSVRRESPVFDEPPPSDNPELPNGGARPAHQGGRRRKVPVLMDPVEVKPPREQQLPDHADETSGPEHVDDTDWQRHQQPADDWDAEPLYANDDDQRDYDARTDHHRANDVRTSAWRDEADEEDEVQGEQHDELEPPDDEPVQAYEDEFEQQTTDPLNDPLANEPVQTRHSQPPSERRSGAGKEQRAPATAQEILVLYVLSKDKSSGFKGQDLLQLLLACDVRYGKNNIFHRYEESKGRGPVQFSVANLVEPGTFDLDRMDQLSTPGLCFFLTLPGPTKSLTAFNYMVETAQVLVKNLGGELRDEGQSVVTPQTLEHCRQRIRDFERRQLTLHL